MPVVSWIKKIFSFLFALGAALSACHILKPLKRRYRQGNITFYIRAEVIADFVQDKVDVLLHRDGMGCDFSGRVCRAGDSHLLPGQEEYDTAVTGGGV